MQKLLTFQEAGERYSMSRYTLRRWARLGRLPVVRLGTRTLRLRPEDLEAVVQANWHPAREPQR